ncbi:MAG: TIGR02266 family protein [Polyangia bacterium]|jgi:uncharacterized protein (TIGR02266 family)|nr:TIGR02266 family protein [Polyangia bacterium]
MRSEPKVKTPKRKGDFKAPEGLDDAAAANRRVTERVLVDLEVDYASDDTYLYAYARNISALGIFLQTRDPQPRGTRLNLRFVLPGSAERIQVEGVVRWVNPYRPGDRDNLNPGMGVEFVSLTEEQRMQIVDLIRLIAYLPDEDRPRHVGG